MKTTRKKFNYASVAAGETFHAMDLIDKTKIYKKGKAETFANFLKK